MNVQGMPILINGGAFSVLPGEIGLGVAMSGWDSSGFALGMTSDIVATSTDFQWAPPYKNFSATAESYIASASNSEEPGAGGAGFAVNGGGNGADGGGRVGGVKQIVGTDRVLNLNWAEFIKVGWSRLPVGYTEVNLTLDGSEIHTYSDIINVVFGALKGKVAAMARLLAESHEVPAGNGVKYKLVLYKREENIFINIIDVHTDSQLALSVGANGKQTAIVTYAGERTRRFEMILGRLIEVDEHSTPCSPAPLPEGERVTIVAKPPVTIQAQLSPAGLVRSMHVAGYDKVTDWLFNHGYPAPTAQSDLNRRLRINAENPWGVDEVISLLDLLHNKGDRGAEYIRKLAGDEAVLLHNFRAEEGRAKITVYVKPNDIIPFLLRGYRFTGREIGAIVEIVSLLRLGAGLKAAGISDEDPASENSIANTIAKVAESIEDRRQVPMPICFSLNGSNENAVNRFNYWMGKLRMAMKNSNKDLFVATPFVASTEFEWDRIILKTISEVGFTGKLWLTKPSGELIGEFDRSMLEEEAVPAEDELSLLRVDGFPGGLIEWVEAYLGTVVSQQSIFYKVGSEISANGMLSLIRKLVADGGPAGKEFLAKLARGEETLTRFVENQAGGFGIDVKVGPAILNDFLDSMNGYMPTSAVMYTEIIDLLSNLRLGWFSVLEGVHFAEGVNENSLAKAEFRAAVHAGEHGIVPKAVIFKKDGGQWENVDEITDLLQASLTTSPDKPFVFILNPSPLEKNVAGRFLEHALNKIIAETGFNSWFMLVNSAGETIYTKGQ